MICKFMLSISRVQLMNISKITKFYQDTQRQVFEETEDPHFIILTMFNALLKSMQMFCTHVDIKAGGQLEQKSKNFARALTIIYALQTSLDFEKGGDIAKNLFQLYEFARVKLLDDLRHGRSDGTQQAIKILSEIRNAWQDMKDVS